MERRQRQRRLYLDPCVHSTVASPAWTASSSSKADLPPPGSPRTTRLPADPRRAFSTSARRGLMAAWCQTPGAAPIRSRCHAGRVRRAGRPPPDLGVAACPHGGPDVGNRGASRTCTPGRWRPGLEALERLLDGHLQLLDLSVGVVHARSRLPHPDDHVRRHRDGGVPRSPLSAPLKDSEVANVPAWRRAITPSCGGTTVAAAARSRAVSALQVIVARTDTSR